MDVDQASSLRDRFNKKLILTKEGPQNPAVPGSASAYAMSGLDNSFDMSEFKNNLKIKVLQCSDELLRVDVSGIDASIANAIRRVMIAEVPTVAIDKVHLWQNTGVIQDEILCHRLGLIPIWVPDIDSVESAKEEGDDFDISGAIKFKLHVKCPSNYPKGKNLHVYSKDMVFDPQTKEQRSMTSPPRPVHPDILIAKLRPNQEIECELFCLKGTGKIHAKWNPVCTASYRLMPEISIPNPVTGEAAETLVNICPKKVFDIEDGQAVVKRPRDCVACRRCIEEIPKDTVELAKVKDYFIFTVESTGCMPAAEIFARALGILKSKCLLSRKHLSEFTTGKTDEDINMDAATEMSDECESIVNDFLRCLVTHKNDRDACSSIEAALNSCNTQIFAAKGVPKGTSYCIDELTDYAKCSVSLNTSMCSSEYTRLHECKLRRRRFILGEDLGLVTMNPQTRKRW